mmetsp:Transcript_9866/g.19269  ORF Transcript_9866/g.19269 Transcript_9866/m.19269 type:complete len:329 (-) Transcript_9866:99-1085(-)
MGLEPGQVPARLAEHRLLLAPRVRPAEPDEPGPAYRGVPEEVGRVWQPVAALREVEAPAVERHHVLAVELHEAPPQLVPRHSELGLPCNPEVVIAWHRHQHRQLAMGEFLRRRQRPGSHGAVAVVEIVAEDEDCVDVLGQRPQDLRNALRCVQFLLLTLNKGCELVARCAGIAHDKHSGSLPECWNALGSNNTCLQVEVSPSILEPCAVFWPWRRVHGCGNGCWTTSRRTRNVALTHNSAVRGTGDGRSDMHYGVIINIGEPVVARAIWDDRKAFCDGPNQENGHAKKLDSHSSLKTESFLQAISVNAESPGFVWSFCSVGAVLLLGG